MSLTYLNAMSPNLKILSRHELQQLLNHIELGQMRLQWHKMAKFMRDNQLIAEATFRCDICWQLMGYRTRSKRLIALPGAVNFSQMIPCLSILEGFGILENGGVVAGLM